MNESVIELYGTFNTKRFPEKPIFGDFHDQPIPMDYYDFLNDNNDNDNNIPGNLIDNFFPDKEGVEDSFVINVTNYDSNNEDIENNTIIDDADSITSGIDLLQDEILEIEGVDTEN